VVSSPPATEETVAMGREFVSRYGIHSLEKLHSLFDVAIIINYFALINNTNNSKYVLEQNLQNTVAGFKPTIFCFVDYKNMAMFKEHPYPNGRVFPSTGRNLHTCEYT
jgi:hypothetical protein